MADFVLRERHGATLLIRINRPERRNAFDLEVRQGIADAVVEARDDDTVRAVVITGTRGIFCAGGDLKSLSEAKRPVFKDRERIRRLHTWFHALVNLEKPVIAAGCHSVAKLCPLLCNPMDSSTPSFSVLYCLPEFAHIHVH